MTAVVLQVCNHRFHNECLQRWGDLKCPVCRYCAQASSTTSHCTVCDTSQVRTVPCHWSACDCALYQSQLKLQCELFGSNRQGLQHAYLPNTAAQRSTPLRIASHKFPDACMLTYIICGFIQNAQTHAPCMLWCMHRHSNCQYGATVLDAVGMPVPVATATLMHVFSRVSMQDLWICLICGHVGCGRGTAKHAVDHWQETGHCYSLELESQRVCPQYIVYAVIRVADSPHQEE